MSFSRMSIVNNTFTAHIGNPLGNRITNAFEGIASINAANIAATDNVITPHDRGDRQHPS
jgi:hypothetical protein